MAKWSICVMAAILTALMGCSDSDGIKLIKKTNLKDYPSASAIEFHNNKLYVIGDDAPTMLVLDNEYNLLQQVTLFPSATKRISKKEKPDIECAFINNYQGANQLIAFSSLSTPKRNKQLVVDLVNAKNSIKSFRVADFDLKASAIPQMNLEGATMIGEYIVLANRANNTYRQNFLVIYSSNADSTPDSNRVILLELAVAKDVIGISGLEYDKEHDLLLFTASTEQTADAAMDGPIGKSYLGFVNGFSVKMSEKKIRCEKLIDLTTSLAEKKSQKIESLAIEHTSNKHVILHLAADNDNGESTLFKLRVELSLFKQPS